MKQPGRLSLNTWLVPLGWLGLLLVLAATMPYLESLFRVIEPDLREVIYRRAGFFTLLAPHVMVVAIASLLAVTLGVGAAIAVTRPAGREFLPVASQPAAIGLTFPLQ